jgi:lysophospholipase L1-like esterase
MALRIAAFLLLVSNAIGAVLPIPGEHWVGTWACSSQRVEPANNPPAPDLTGFTLRQVIHVSLGGRRVRLRLTNVFGDAALTFTAVHLARSAGGSAIDPATNRVLTFAGAQTATLPAGAPLLSDPVDFEVGTGADLAITLRIAKAPQAVTGHPGSRTTSFLVRGDFAAAAALPSPLRTDHWYFIEGLDVVADQSAGALVTLGDSITDGRGSTTNGNNRWPDQLVRRLQATNAGSRVGVLNAGIGGNRLLHDGIGPNALARFDRDVIAQAGVRWLVVFEGINDLGTAVGAAARGETAATPADIILAYQQCIERAHAHGIRVFGATITAFEGAAAYDRLESEAGRQTINRWIRTSGRFDGVIDFDAATRDPRRPARLDPAYDSSDHLHLNPSGYERMARAVDLALLERSGTMLD